MTQKEIIFYSLLAIVVATLLSIFQPKINNNFIPSGNCKMQMVITYRNGKQEIMYIPICH